MRPPEICATVGTGATPHALSCKQHAVASLARVDDLRFRPDTAGAAASQIAAKEIWRPRFAARLGQARDLSGALARQGVNVVGAQPDRAGSAAGERLELIRTLLKQDQPVPRLLHGAPTGSDTHASQASTHRSLWDQVSQAVSGFLDKIKKQDQADDVAVFIFSEFGRRVKENGSQGTDHGAAAPVFQLGEKLRGGVQGACPTSQISTTATCVSRSISATSTPPAARTGCRLIQHRSSAREENDDQLVRVKDFPRKLS